MLRSKLQSIKSSDSNLYQHLVKIIRQLILKNDKDGYHLFEYYSQNIEAIEQASSEYRIEEFQQLADYICKQTVLLDKPSAGTEQEPIEVGPCGYIPNLLEEAKSFEKVGVGMGEELTYQIFKSLERFSIQKQVKELKLWGRVNCLEHDYYVAEGGVAEAGQEAELPTDVEPKGMGINKSSFYVCIDLLSADWHELPIITPQQLKVSRRIKYTFTGDLQRDIFTNPFFPGKESHLLKCQLIRINFNCTLVPRTMYNVNSEDMKQIQAAEQWKMPPFEFLSKLENWVHLSQNVLLNGRTTHLKPEPVEGEEEVDEEKLMKDLEKKDPFEERLKPLSTDFENSWAICQIGDCNEYRGMSKVTTDFNNYGYIHLKNLIWRGWHMIYHNKQWLSTYVGNAAKCPVTKKGEQEIGGYWFYPKEPETVLQEVEDYDEVQEPNFPPEQPKGQQGEEGAKSDQQ